jgi:hypothetical protein
LENTLEFMENCSLDIVACGTEFVEMSENGNLRIVEERKAASNIIIEGSGFGDKFVQYKPYTNEMWGKLYKLSITSDVSLRSFNAWHYDSQVVLNQFRSAKKVGILAEILHQAYLGSGTLRQSIKGTGNPVQNFTPIENVARGWIDGLDHSIGVTYKISWENVNRTFYEYKNYLFSFGEISAENLDYLYAIYIGWIHENLVTLYMSGAIWSGHRLYAELKRLIESESFQDAFSHISLGKYQNFDKRMPILKQMYNFMTICEYGMNNPEFPRFIKEKIEFFRTGLGL